MMEDDELTLYKKYAYVPLWLSSLTMAAQGLWRSITQCYPLSDKADLHDLAPLFIVSAGRSGTTLMRSMLVAGEQIAIPPETQMLHKLPVKFSAYRFLGWKDMCKLMVAEFESSHYFPQWDIDLVPVYEELFCLTKQQRSLARIIHTIMMHYAAKKFPRASIWGDQSPINTYYLPFLRCVFPQAKYLHLVRDGRDVISSMITRRGDAYMDEAIYRWNTSIQRITKFKQSLQASQYLEIHYEDLVNQAETSLKQVSQFMHIDYTIRMLDYWKLPTTIESKIDTFHKNLEKPVFSSSIGAWKERLTPEQQAYLSKRIAKQLKTTGYAEADA